MLKVISTRKRVIVALAFALVVIAVLVLVIYGEFIGFDAMPDCGGG